jgi:hypothetical protein
MPSTNAARTDQGEALKRAADEYYHERVAVLPVPEVGR